MSEFGATGHLVIDSIEGADAALEDEFSVSASDAVSAGGGGRNRSVKRITDNLDETVDLAETRNDLLRDIQETSEDGSFRITRSLRSLGRGSVAAALGGGALVTAALSQSPNDGPQPSDPDQSEQADPNTGESDIVDPVTITAAQVIASGAAVPASQVVASGATVTAAEIIAAKAGIGSGDVIDTAVELGTSDVVDAAVELSTGDIITAAIELGKSDVLADAASGAAVALGAGDVVDPVELRAKDVIDVNIGAKEIIGAITGGGVAGGVAKALSDLGSTGGSAGAAGVGPPVSIIPQVADTLNDVTPRDIIPGPDKEEGIGTVSRGDTNVEVTNNIDTNGSMDRRERDDIISEAVREMRRELRRDVN